MPVLTIHTNIAKESIPADFASKTVDIVSGALGKPKSYVVVNVVGSQNLNWGGSAAPAAVATLGSIGQINREANKNTSALLSNHLEKELNIPGSRFYVNFEDWKAENVGYNGTTFAEILGQ